MQVRVGTSQFLNRSSWGLVSKSAPRSRAPPASRRSKPQAGRASPPECEPDAHKFPNATELLTCTARTKLALSILIAPGCELSQLHRRCANSHTHPKNVALALAHPPALAGCLPGTRRRNSLDPPIAASKCPPGRCRTGTAACCDPPPCSNLHSQPTEKSSEPPRLKAQEAIKMPAHERGVQIANCHEHGRAAGRAK